MKSQRTIQALQKLIDELIAQEAALRPAAETARAIHFARKRQKAKEEDPAESLQIKRQRGVFEKIPGSGIWSIRYSDAEGKFHRELIGRKSSALLLYAKRKNAALEGRKLPELNRRGASFDDLADDAVTYVKARYARPADDVARLEVLKTIFSGRADAITPVRIENALDTLAGEKRWSASSRNHHHNLISLAYRLGIKHGKVKENPARAVERKGEGGSRRVRFLSPDEEKKLRETIRSNPVWAEHEPELDLALNSGLRRGSMYRDLTWENVDLVGRTLTIPRTKNGEPITLPLNADAMQALAIFRARGDGRGRVVRNAAGETLEVNAHWFVPAVRAAKINNFRWHDCRHCFASRLRQNGVPLGHIAELLGHKGLAMSQRYAHLSISNLHHAVSRISTGTPVAPAPIPEIPESLYVQ
jgi:integrase